LKNGRSVAHVAAAPQFSSFTSNESISRHNLSKGMYTKTFVRATADYITNEPNLLSFKKGEIIQIITSDNWLYGRISNQYGNLPANYVHIPLWFK
uniref:SH3 domain-containing protein n=1 Tax=Parascaris equorum TaxID=6256 RepID=A0A914RJ95_PAREQ